MWSDRTSGRRTSIAGCLGPALLAGLAGCLSTSTSPLSRCAAGPPPLSVEDGGRFLVQRLPDGTAKPFFWLGDTAWNLHRLTLEEIDHYLEDRASKGFNVIQGPVLDWTGLTDRKPLSRFNAYGEAAYLGKESHPELNADRGGNATNDYFDQADYILNRAAELGMYVALLPFWAQGINDLAEQPRGHSALERIGELLGARYRERTNVLWIVGGEAAGESDPKAVNALAVGLDRGHGGRHLMSVHPGGAKSSSAGRWQYDGESGVYAYHHEPWLDFNMIQSGHGAADRATYDRVTADYLRGPTKPSLESEYWYEGGYPTAEDAVSTAFDQRKGAYWSVFAGGFGYTYGANGVWQFTGGDEVWDANDYRSTHEWRTALEYEGSAQMVHLRRLLESRRPSVARIPDQSLILAGAGRSGEGVGDHVRATRDGTPEGGNATFILAYVPAPRTITLDTRDIDSPQLEAWWYDPRSGAATPLLDAFTNTGTVHIPPRQDGEDWVLVVEDARAGYPPPGVVTGGCP